MTVTDVRDALLSVCDHVYHYRAGTEVSCGYVVWGETGQRGAFDADDAPEAIVIHGELYYYTATEYDNTIGRICAALSEAGISWTISNIGYDDTIGRIVYSAEWEICCGAGEIY